MKKVFTFFAVVIVSINLVAQPTCADLRNGISYSYWPETSDQFITIIEGSNLTEIAVNLDDTVKYRIDWIDDCAFSQQYVSGGNKLPKRILDFNKQHIFYYKIDNVTEDYFVTRVYQDKMKGRMLKRDTSWFAPKIAVASSTDFQKVSGPLYNSQTTFKDSANFALVYVYRPKKVMLFLARYPLYFDDQVMCIIENNSGYLFKIKKEGTHQFATRQFKDADSVSVDIKFGQKYFIKPSIEWGIKKHLYNFKLHVEQITDMAEGAREFDAVKLK